MGCEPIRANSQRPFRNRWRMDFDTYLGQGITLQIYRELTLTTCLVNDGGHIFDLVLLQAEVSYSPQS